jgi:hypothetical protein
LSSAWKKSVERVGVKQWQRRHQHIAVADAEKATGVGRPPKILGVRTAHAFRQAGCAGCVENGEGIAGLDRMWRHAVARLRERSRRKGMRLALRPLAFADEP